MAYDTETIRKDFPILHQKVYGYPYVYLDNGATTQKPQEVIDAISNLYKHANSSVHRGVHFFSEKTTAALENSRRVVQEFIHASSTSEVIFTRGSTESINLVAFSYGDEYVHEGDEILVTAMEHHSNIVPWQMLCKRKNARLRALPMNERGELLMEKLPEMLNEKTKMVAVTQVSNSLGTINPVKEITRQAHEHNIPVLVDGAQGIQHLEVDVKDIGCDFFVFSGHKIYGPTGIGVLYGKEEWLEKLPPYQGGGEMIDQVTFEETTYNELPFKFEAGTPNYVAAIGLSRALQYISRIGIQTIQQHEKQLLDYGTEKLNAIEGLRIIGTAETKSSILSFLMDGIHHYDAGTLVDKMGIAIRTGHHCTQPVMQFFGIEGTLRASIALYNNFDDIDRLQQALLKVKTMFG